MTLSVLVATRNRPATLQRCLESIGKQHCSDLEILVLDDASTPPLSTEDLPDTLLQHRLNIIRSDTPLGVAAARNQLMQQATGKVLFVLDDDATLPEPDSLNQMNAAFERDPEVGILAFKITNHVEEQTHFVTPHPRRHLKNNPALLNTKGLASYFVGAGHALRREVFDACGPYRTDLIYAHEELDLSYRVLDAGFKILYLPDITVHHFPAPSVLPQTAVQDPELYYHLRNRLLLAWTYLPWRFLPTHVGFWLLAYGQRALRSKSLGTYFAGLKSTVSELKRSKRRPIQRHTVAYLKAHHGRLWY